MVFETDYDFLSALRDAKQNYLTSRDSHFGQLKSRVQEAIVDAASKGKQKASIVVDGFPSEVISDVVGWFQSIGMSADHYTGDQRDPANEIQVGRF